MRAAADALAGSLADIFNCSLRTGTVPLDFKLANITPILKPKQDPFIAQSYRGISLTSILSKVLEKVVRQQILDFFRAEELFSDQQYGFRPGRCCEDLLLASVDKWQVAKDDGKAVAVIFLDLSKAFDNVQHQTLLFDLGKRHFAGSALTWIRDYLSHRFQNVVVDGQTCEPVQVTKGVPQGSVLGPTLFNIYLSHLPDIVESMPVEIPSYADDVTLFSIANCLQEAMSSVSIAAFSIGQSLAERGLPINIKRSCAMLMGPRSAVSCKNLMYKDFTVPTVRSAKFLGVVIDDHLSWDDHFSDIVAKMGRKIGAFHRARRLLNPQARKMLLLSVILPDLEYCCSLFACSLRTPLRLKLEALERRAVRICVGADRSAPCEPLYASLKISPLKHRWLIRLLCLTFEAVKGLRPAAVNSLFAHHQLVYNTCGRSSLVLPRRANHAVARHSFYFRSSLWWNALPSTVWEVQSLPEFKCQLLSLSISDVDSLANLAFSVLPE